MRQQVFDPLGMNSTTDRQPGNADHQPRRWLRNKPNHLRINRDYDLTDVFFRLARWSRPS